MVFALFGPLTLPHQTARNERFGLMVTVLGALVFVPDALILRLIAGNMMDVAVWRGLWAALITGLGVLIFARHLIPSWAELTRPATVLFILLHGGGSVLFLSALGLTSVANVLLISATSPFWAALLSWALLGERVERATGLGIAAVFLGVVIIAMGAPGGGQRMGDALALISALANAAYYVVLRHMGQESGGPQSQIAPSVLGFVVTALLAWPLAPHLPMDLGQMALIAVSGGVVLSLGCALLIIGPRYLPAAEVTMITMLESVASPLLVWLVIGENPGGYTLVGGAVIFATLMAHAAWRWRRG